MVRAARLDAALYEEVERDPALTVQALAVVLLASLAAGLGAFQRAGPNGLVAVAVGAVISWYVWAFLSYWIGTRLLPDAQTHADMGQLLRAIGFSSSPGLIRALGIIPGLGLLAFAAGNIWMLVAMVVAVRHALDYRSTWRALGVVAIGWVIHSIVLWLIIGAMR
jgi:hypothetical protein